MQAIVALMERIDGHLIGSGKLIEGRTKTDIRAIAKTIATQSDARLSDIIFDDSRYWQDYLKNLAK